MKESFKSTRKYLVIPVALGMVAIIALSGASTVSAFQRSRNSEDLSAAIAQRFGLNQEDVQATVDEFKEQRIQEHHDQMTDHFADRLAAAVEEGKITQGQMNAILDKHDEMFDRMVELEEQDLSREDIRELKADLHDEFEIWAHENGIDMSELMMFDKDMMGPGSHMGRGPHAGF